MSELPFDKPTQDLTWENGAQTEPSAGRRLSGWEAGGDRPAGEFNWRYDAIKNHVGWIDDEIYLPRIFTDGVEILDTIPAGTTVRLQAPQDWTDGDVTKTTPGAVTHMVTDSRRVYYIVGTTLYAATADAVSGEQNEWSVDLSSDGLAGVDFISTDGQIVTVFGDSSTSGKILLVYTVANLGLSPEAVDEIVITGAVRSIHADSISSTRRVWIGVNNTTTVAGDLLIWTTAGGLVLATSLGIALDGMAIGDEHILMRRGGNLRYVKKEDYTVNTVVSTLSFAFDFADGSTFHALNTITKAVHHLGPKSSFRPGLGVHAVALTSSSEAVCVVGDGLVITKLGAYSIQGGGLLHLFEVPSDGPLALAGQYIWCVIGGALVARPVGLRGGEVWERRSDGSDETIGRSDATTRLLIRQE